MHCKARIAGVSYEQSSFIPAGALLNNMEFFCFVKQVLVENASQIRCAVSP